MIILGEMIDSVEYTMYVDLILEEIQQRIDFFTENRKILSEYQRGKLEAYMEDMQTIKNYYIKKTEARCDDISADINVHNRISTYLFGSKKEI